MNLFLVINDVDEYVYEEKVKTINRLNIKEENINHHIKVRASDNLYYENNIIYNNLSDEMKSKFNFQKSCAYQI